MLSSSIKFILDVIFTITFASPYLWNISEKLFPFIDTKSEFQRGLVFVFLETSRSFFIDLPFTIYYSFVIEERHGFNKLTLAFY